MSFLLSLSPHSQFIISHNFLSSKKTQMNSYLIMTALTIKHSLYFASVELHVSP